MAKTVLIVGVTGQDGAYLAHHLLTLGYRVVGTSRDAQTSNSNRLVRLGIQDSITVVSLAPNDFRSVLKVVSDVAPAEIYSLAGQTSVGLSFEQPVECMESTAGGTRNLLEVIRYLQIPARLFSAGSSECFGDTREEPANETTALHPQSPYAVAKATAYWQVANYRKAYGMHACTGIMANHESPLRPDRFVTQKIVQGVRKIKRGEAERITLGNLEIWRDWGWAPEYTQAMHLMLQSDQPEDFLIASGRTTSLRDFVERAFAAAGLRSADHLELDVSMLRPNDVAYSAMNPSRIEKQLGWKAQTTISQIVDKMYAEELF